MVRRIHRRPSFTEASGCYLPLALAMLLLVPQAHAFFPRHDNRQVHKEVEQLEMEWRQAVLDNNASAMERLLADDYVGISANGTIETKAQVLAQRKAGTVHFTQLDLNDVKVRLYGDTAVVTSQADLQGKNGERDISGKYRYTRVYNRRFGQWKIVSFEASRINDNSDRSSQKH
jgi:ketosteroid isomerase-like protein